MIDESLRRAKELLRLGQVEAAEAVCREVQRQAPEQPLVWQLLGYAALCRGEAAEAEELLRRAVALDPGQPLPYCQLAIVILRQGRAKEAQAFARFAVQLDSASSSNWTRLGECLAAQRRWDDAAQALGEATRRNPQDAAALALLGQVQQTRSRSIGPDR